MKRYLQLGLVGLATVTAIATTAILSPLAIAQTRPLIEALELTEAQQAQIQAILLERQASISDVLTDSQRTQFQTTYQETQNLRAAIDAMDDLTADQRDAIKGVFQSSREEFTTVLTEEQQAEFRAFVEERRQGR